MSAAAERAVVVAELPHVRAWVRRFRALAKSMPPEVWVFCESGSPFVMALNPEGQPYLSDRVSDGCVDQDAIVEQIHGAPSPWDGGGW